MTMPHPSFLSPSIWDQWLWHEDPLEECHIDLMLNRMHLLGLLIARYRAAYQDRFHQSDLTLHQILCEGLLSPSLQERQQQLISAAMTKESAATALQQERQRRNRLCLFDQIPVRALTLRQLRDTIQNIQLQWVPLQVAETMQPQIMEAIDALMHRFGVLASQPWPLTSVMDDQGSIEQCNLPSAFVSGAGVANSNTTNNTVTTTLVKLNRICIRRFVNVFLAFHRHMYLWNERQVLADPEDTAIDCGIKLHHILAATDDFTTLSMHWDLMPAAKLNYVHDFRGMYNCISQVFYFHDPDYQRRPQVG